MGLCDRIQGVPASFRLEAFIATDKCRSAMRCSRLKKCYLKVNTEKSLSSRQKKEKCLIEPGTKPDVGGRLETTKKFKF